MIPELAMVRTEPLPWSPWAVIAAILLVIASRAVGARQPTMAKGLNWIAMVLFLATLAGEYGIL
jgi:hypothetical protein